jgi:putative transposase
MANYTRVFLDGFSYFVTVVTHQRNPILIDNINLLREAFVKSKDKYEYTIDNIVILPDHFHMIITPKHAEDYSKIISFIKRYFSRNCFRHYYAHLLQSSSRENRGMKPIWQKRFFEHTIKNEKDLFETTQYMYHNPVKHGYVDDPKIWKYSSWYKK